MSGRLFAADSSSELLFRKADSERRSFVSDFNRTMLNSKISSRLFLAASILLFCGTVVAQIPTPKSVLGFHPTDDKTIADWNQITKYFEQLDKASNRLIVREIGKSTLGRPLIVAFISSPSNILHLERYRKMNARLANPAGASQRELDALVKTGRTIVSISCSIHSTEIVASQMSMNLAYELATAKDSETLEILDNTILLLIPSPNPDGIQIVADWYRKTLGTKSEGTSPPDLYHHYAGHDNNRDWFMMNLAETQAVTKLFWQEWFPQIVYDVHQMGQTGPRFIIPPFYDPPNPRIPPSVLRDVGLIGYKMAADLQAKEIAGVATNTTFDTWWHGGFRSAPYYHNSVGILSEAASANLMSPATITKDQLLRNRPSRGLSSPLASDTAHPDPWLGGVWRPRDIAEIETIASRSLLSLAAKYRRHFLDNFVKLNRKNLVLDATEPKAFIIPSGQPNHERVARFIDILRWQGIEVELMTHELYMKMSTAEDFHEMPLNSFLVFTNQLQKNNVLSLFEKQVYPKRVDSNGEPDPPYDVAGWTLPLQMDVEVHEVWDIRELDKYRATLKRIRDSSEPRAVLNLPPTSKSFPKFAYPLKTRPNIGLYKSHVPSMDEGWTRFVFDTFDVPFKSVNDAQIRNGELAFDSIILPADSETSIVSGLDAKRYPDDIAGGIGDVGIENLKAYVRKGGKLICFDDSCRMVIRKFGLPIRNVLDGLKRNEFYNPGSIVRIDINRGHALGQSMPESTAAFFSNSSAFEILESSPDESSQIGKITAVARYSTSDTLLSGWMLGGNRIAGKLALIEVNYGAGKVVMFAFRPQHRGQTFATFPLIFNSIEK